ncbi:hypothetical protein SAMN05216420_11396 [Nitrosospira sp. Nl5]|uniref:hypothetical protein n=1 Tax=Nitrosospira sp. Nl5 TaxID=200120 RepID=UPI00088FEFAD|nr:hypothetical protein [Nitrosospira sp. Nl5]SCY70341.1 hypothetical protein SAMN05216420_11396 [Nitrosospira sp. Nl5]
MPAKPGSEGSKYIADFDSASAFLQSTARFLHGKDFPALGQNPLLGYFASLVNLLPRRGREFVYTIGGGLEATKPSDIGDIKSRVLATWAAGLYPRRPYPAIVIGSSSGALPHLCAALGVAWLPQTFLIPVKQSGIPTDDPRKSMEAGKKPGRILLDNNPDLQLHQMHDPNQDRLMLQEMMYFRVKWHTLPDAYKYFITQSLPPGGTIIICECERTWPTTKVAERHYFQFGALGGATEDEVFHGGPRIEEYLKRYKVLLKKWDPPAPDARRPEAEWGFEAKLRGELEGLAEDRSLNVVRLVFTEPEDLSPFTADLYRWWYKKRGIPANRLLVESFVIHEPWWTLRTGSVPFWMKFNMEDSAAYLEQYLNDRAPFDEMNMMLFNHGIEGPGLVPIERWKELLSRARKESRFIGVAPDKYPLDFGSFGAYYRDIKKIPARYPLPAPLKLGDLATFMEESVMSYNIKWQGLEEARSKKLKQ